MMVALYIMRQKEVELLQRLQWEVDMVEIGLGRVAEHV